MKILLLRCTLALIMCGASASAWADEYIINEDFSEVTETYIDNRNYKGWELWDCRRYNGIFRIEKYHVGSKDHNGYVKTPALSYTGDVIVEFSYAKLTNTSIDFSISIEGKGKFEDNAKTNYTLTTKDTYYPVQLKLLGVSNETRIVFGANTLATFGLGYVRITKDGMTLSEAGNNKDFITAHPDTTMTVKTSRTLKHGIWNTMCLPFEVTTSQMQQALGTADFQMRTYTGYAGGVMTFTTASTIPAGTPFLVKPNTEEDIANPTFEYVTIKATADTVVNHDGVKFIGTYSGRDLNIDGTHLFITTDGTVARPASNTQNHLKGLRAYIEVPSSITNARLNIDGETVDIQQIDADDDYSTALYDLKGLRLERPKKGLCIKDGKLIFIK